MEKKITKPIKSIRPPYSPLLPFNCFVYKLIAYSDKFSIYLVLYIIGSKVVVIKLGI